jgi:hypothetical protein
VHEEIGALRGIDRRRARPRVAGDDHLPPRTTRPDHQRRLDLSSVLQRDRDAAMDLAP